MKNLSTFEPRIEKHYAYKKKTSMELHNVNFRNQILIIVPTKEQTEVKTFQNRKIAK